MLGRFLDNDAAAIIIADDLPETVKRHCLEVIWKGYTVIPSAVPKEECDRIIQDFRDLEKRNDEIFAPNRDVDGHYPRIVNLHLAFPRLISLFTNNETHLAVSDALFGAPTALYTTLFYETGSQQPLHRDSPVFCTRPENLYFGNTVYLEPANDENGCLEVVEGGHLIGELDRERIAVDECGSLDTIAPTDDNLWNVYQNGVVTRCGNRGLKSIRIHVEAGDTLIWHPQLPHGGSPIQNKNKTRFSLVMHTTPEGVPVYHQDAFFRPNMPYPETARWGYREVNGRKIAEQQGISFGHIKEVAIDAFR